MATIGLDSIYYAKIEADSNGNEVYGVPVRLAKAINAGLTINTTDTKLTADGECIDIIQVFDDGRLTLNIDELGTDAAASLLGAKIDSNDVIISSKEDIPKLVAIGFRARRADGTYKYVWLYRVLFGIPGAESATKLDSIAFSSQRIEGIISRRKRIDYNGDHPWKSELNENTNSLLSQANHAPQQVLYSGIRINRAEDDAAGLAISHNNWFDSVYEPNGTLSRDTEMATELGG